MKSDWVRFVAIGPVGCAECSVLDHWGVKTSGHAGLAWQTGGGGQRARA
jgi:hypothetical protein